MIASFGMGFFMDSNRSSIDQALHQIASDQGISASELERAAIEGMLRASGDRWSNYRDATQVAAEEDELDGRYSGVGIWLRPGTGGGTECRWFAWTPLCANSVHTIVVKIRE